MLVRFFEHGKVKKGELTRTGGGGAVRNYLLFDKNDKTKLRSGARLIYGNDVDTTEIINGIKNSKIYTSGVLSFAPEESITESQKIEIIESFEQNLFPGLAPGEYSGYWVEHKDKDRQELHFVFADIHLPSGKSLPVYYHGKDLKLVDSWKDLINIDYGLEDPNDPKRQRAYRLKGYEYSQQKQQEIDAQANLSAQKEKKVFIEEAIALHLIEAIANDETIQTHDDVVRLIADMFEITRIAKDGKSISIKNPDGGRNIKLKGMIYERDFKRQDLETLGREQTKKPANRSELQAINQREREKRQLRLEQRFARHRLSDRQLEQAFDRKLVEIKSSADPRSPASDQSIDTQDERVVPDSEQFGANRVRNSGDRQVERERQSRFNEPGGSRGVQQHGQSEQNYTTNHSPRHGDTQSAGDNRHPKGSDPASKAGKTTQQAGIESHHAHRIRDFSRCRFIRYQLLSGHSGAYHPADFVYITTAYQSNAPRGSSFIDGQSLSEQRQRGRGTDYAEESSHGILGQQSEKREDLARDASDRATRHRIQQKVAEHETINPYRANHQNLTDVVTKFAQPDRRASQTDNPTAASSGHAGSFIIDTELARTAYTDYQRRNPTPAQTPAAGNGDLLTRIKEYQSTAAKNAQVRAGRISTLTRKNPINVEPISSYTTRRRKRVRKFTDKAREFNSDITAEYLAEQERTKKLRQLRQRADDVKNGFNHNAHELEAIAAGFGQLAAAVAALVKAVIEMFKRLFNGIKQQAYGYASEGLLYHIKPDGSEGQQATTQEARDFIDNHPYDLSGYAQLRLTVQTWDKQKKEQENTPKFRGFGM